MGRQGFSSCIFFQTLLERVTVCLLYQREGIECRATGQPSGPGPLLQPCENRESCGGKRLFDFSAFPYQGIVFVVDRQFSVMPIVISVNKPSVYHHVQCNLFYFEFHILVNVFVFSHIYHFNLLTEKSFVFFLVLWGLRICHIFSPGIGNTFLLEIRCSVAKTLQNI